MGIASLTVNLHQKNILHYIKTLTVEWIDFLITRKNNASLLRFFFSFCEFKLDNWYYFWWETTISIVLLKLEVVSKWNLVRY